MAVWRIDPDLSARFHPQYPDHLQVLLHDGEPRRTHRTPEACWVAVTALHGRMRFANVICEAGAPRSAERVHWIERPVYRAALLHAPHALTTIRDGEALLFLVVPGIPYPLQVHEPYLAERARWAFRPCDRCGADQALDPPSTMARTRFGDKPDWSPLQFTAFCPCRGTMELQRLDQASDPPGHGAATPSQAAPPRPDRASAGSSKPPRTRWVWIPDPEGRALAFTYVDRVAGPSAKGAKVGDAPGEDDIRRAVDRPDVTFRDPDRFGAVPVSPEEALRLGLPRDPPWIGHFERKPIPPPRGEPSRVVSGRVLHGGAPVGGARVKMGVAFGRAHELVALDERVTDRDGSFAFPLAPMRDVVVIADSPGMSSRQVPVPADARIDVELARFGGMAGHLRRAGAPVAAQVSLVGLDGEPHRIGRSNGDGRYRIDDLVPGRYDVEVEALDDDGMTNGTAVSLQVDITGGRVAAHDVTLAAGTIVHVSVQLSTDDDSAHVYLVTGAIAVQRESQLRPLFHAPALRSANHLATKDRRTTTEFRDVVPGEYTVCVSPWDRRGGGHHDQPVASRVIVVAGAPQTVELELPRLLE